MTRARTAVVAVAVAVAASVAGCSGGSPGLVGSSGSAALSAPAGQHGSSASAGSLAWGSCPPSAGGAPGGRQLRCAHLQVPLNYSDPGGRKITLALSEIPATAPAGQRQGVLLVNPGGPGAPGVPFAASTAAGLSPSVSAKYDIVGFDPRGAEL
jgi:hypothetical protein